MNEPKKLIPTDRECLLRVSLIVCARIEYAEQMIKDVLSQSIVDDYKRQLTEYQYTLVVLNKEMVASRSGISS